MLKSEILFVDPAVSDIATILGGLRPEVEAIVLDSSRPAARQIAKALREQARPRRGARHRPRRARAGEVCGGGMVGRQRWPGTPTIWLRSAARWSMAAISGSGVAYRRGRRGSRFRYAFGAGGGSACRRGDPQGWRRRARRGLDARSRRQCCRSEAAAHGGGSGDARGGISDDGYVPKRRRKAQILWEVARRRQSGNLFYRPEQQRQIGSPGQVHRTRGHGGLFRYFRPPSDRNLRGGPPRSRAGDDHHLQRQME